jgi:hypothetical protein
VITLDCNYNNDYTRKETALAASDKVVLTIKVADEKDARITPAVTAADGTASVPVTAAQLTEAAEKVKKTGGDIVIAPAITGSAGTVRTELPRASVSAVALQTDADLLISTPLGSLSMPNDTLASIAPRRRAVRSRDLGRVSASALAEALREAVGDT